MTASTRDRRPRQFTVGEAGTLLPWLVANVPGTTRTEAKSLLRHGAVAVNGRATTRHDHPLAGGDVVTIAPKPGADVIAAGARGVVARGGIGVAAGANADDALPFAILFEDEHFVAIDKPSGLLTIGTDTERARTAHRLLGDRERAARPAGPGRVFVVHRLDRDTSGVVIFAKSEAAKHALQERWEAAEKEYVAIVDGVPDPAEATLVHWLREDPVGLRVHVVAEGPRGQRAVTHYRVRGAGEGRALLEVRTETGRKHQIRVQLAAIGHPVCGDPRYAKKAGAHEGKGSVPADDDAAGAGRGSRGGRAGARSGNQRRPRLALHATRLSFPHPLTGASTTIDAPLPRDLAQLVRPPGPTPQRRKAS